MNTVHNTHTQCRVRNVNLFFLLVKFIASRLFNREPIVNLTFHDFSKINYAH